MINIVRLTALLQRTMEFIIYLTSAGERNAKKECANDHNHEIHAVLVLPLFEIERIEALWEDSASSL
jgi:hypothetical protein